MKSKHLLDLLTSFTGIDSPNFSRFFHFFTFTLKMHHMQSMNKKWIPVAFHSLRRIQPERCADKSKQPSCVGCSRHAVSQQVPLPLLPPPPSQDGRLSGSPSWKKTKGNKEARGGGNSFPLFPKEGKMKEFSLSSRHRAGPCDPTEPPGMPG